MRVSARAGGVVVAVLVASVAAYAVVTRRHARIDEPCSFGFQCATYDGFGAPECREWEQGTRCTLACAPSSPRPCPDALSCRPDEVVLTRGGHVALTIPTYTCHATPP